jgi:phosphoglycolate phosphatase-like HAD superfamily hydrolase
VATGAPVVLALDFDGVVCDGRAEYFESARRACALTWPGPAPLPAVAARFAALRPLVEGGWEMPLLLHALAGGVDPSAVGDRRAWVETARRMLAQTGESAEALGRTLNRVRDEWFAADPAGWVAHHAMYPGVPERMAAALDDGVRVVIVTTKAERFARALLAAHSARLGALPIVGREPSRTIPKLETLARLAREHDLHEGAGLWFVEDLLETLESVRQAPGLAAARLFLAAWGYNTIEDRARVGPSARIALLSRARFTGAFPDWPSP